MSLLSSSRWVSFASILLLAGVTPVSAQSADVAGKWSLVIRTPEGPQLRSFDLVVSRDSTVTGTVGSPWGAVPISSGRVAGNRLELEFAMAGGQIRVSYDVRVQRDTLRGVFRQEGQEGAVLGVRGERAVRFPTPPGA